MLSVPAPFPFIGSQGFERGTCRPLTVIQHRRDGRVLTRRDDVGPQPDAAHGNFTLALADLCETREIAAEPLLKPKPASSSGAVGRRKRARKAVRK